MSEPTLAGEVPVFPRVVGMGMISGTIGWAKGMTETLKRMNDGIEALIQASQGAESAVGDEGGTGA